jgi:uncharacterized protein (DUF1697 family)
MPVLISMLRGINVGGHNMIGMEALRAMYAALGLRDAQTYVQSGNVVFRTDERDVVALGPRIETAIERKFGFRPAVILRSGPELKRVIARNPFASRPEIEPNKLLVMFLGTNPAAEALSKVRAIKADPEELRLDGSHIYIYFPNGMGRPKLSWLTVEKILRVPATGRNWNSVTKLAEMAEKLDAS